MRSCSTRPVVESALNGSIGEKEPNTEGPKQQFLQWPFKAGSLKESL